MEEFLKWIKDLEYEYSLLDPANNGCTFNYAEGLKALAELYTCYYSAKKKNDLTTCKAVALDVQKTTQGNKILPSLADGFVNSPIEALMLSGIYARMNEQDWKWFYPQPLFEVCDNKYRVDIAFCRQEETGEAFLAVECDGFDYHYAKKEQISRDNKRTREIQYTGIELLHVLGSDIYRNPLKEAEMVLNHIRGKYFGLEIKELHWE